MLEQKVNEEELNYLVTNNFIKLSKPVECEVCHNTAKFIGESRTTGGWICPFCRQYYPYKDFPDIEIEVPFTKLSNQLEINTLPMKLSQPLSTPVTVDFPMDISTGFLVPNYSSGYRIKRKTNNLLGQAIDFTRYGRIKSGMIWQFDLGYDDRQVSEYETLAAFALTQGSHLPFNYTDPFRGSAHVCYFDSDISDAEPVSFDGVSFSISISE